MTDEPRDPDTTEPPSDDEPRDPDTTEQPSDDEPRDPDTTEQPSDEAPPPRRLTRSGSDALIGGVAAGLGRYFGIDPILFRIGFVVLTFVGGIGVLAYLALLAFVPSDGHERPGGTSRAAAVAGAVVLGIAVVIFLSPPLFFFGPGLLVLALVGLAAVLLWRAFGGEPGGDPARTIGRIALAALIGVATLGAAIGVGVVAALGGGVVIASLAVVAGLVLIGTAFVGGARWLIVPALALVLPLGVVAAADIDLDGGIGDREYRPATMSELRDRYEIGIGSVHVDLTDLELPAGRTDVAVQAGLGEAVLYVPDGACVTSDVEIGVGGADVLDREQHGVDVSVVERASTSAARPHLHVAADVGMGVLEVVREGDVPDFGRDWRRDRFEDGWRRDRFDGDRLPSATGCA
jgi:phage shock protein PspC (stress-responsive transcriptional regulator)